MQLVRPTVNDWNLFNRWAKAEGWSVPAYELDLYRGELADDALVLKDGDACCGFVTAVAYEKSGWIGNLVVPEHLRGKGYGRELFEQSIKGLEQRGIDSIWLTASEMGQPLYQQYGFEAIGTIERFVLMPKTAPEKTATAQPSEKLLAASAAFWDESRAALLSPLSGQSCVFASGDSCALLQQHTEFQIIGPWYSPARSSDELSEVLQGCLAHLKPGIKTVIDMVQDQMVGDLLQTTGFTATGTNRLMVKGCHDHIDHGSLVSLASLGSMG